MRIQPVFEELHVIIELNAYAVDIRYPDDTLEIALEDAREAYTIARKVRAFVEDKLSA